MDPVTELFRSVQLKGSIFFSEQLVSPWKLELARDDAPRFHIVLAGETWLKVAEQDELLHLTRGQALFLNDGGAHTICDSLVDDKEPAASTCHLIFGSFGFNGDHPHPLIDLLPKNIQISIPESCRSFWSLAQIMVDEISHQDSGRAAMVDRLCEMFLIQLLRRHVESNPMLPCVCAALEDPYTRKGLKLIHDHPDSDWTIESLAQSTGLSRSAFAKRFHHLVGMPPKTYLTGWRMHKAKALLANPHVLVSSVAQDVGYSSATAFNRAFKEYFGTNPGAYQLDTN